jgi:hypothetical protein
MRPLHVNIGRQIISGMPKPIRSDHPDRFTAQALAQGVERTDLVVNPMHTDLATRVSLHHEFAPMRGHDACTRDRAINGNVLCAAVSVGLDEGQRVDDGTMCRRVGSAIEGIEQRREQTPIMPTVRGSSNGRDMTPRRGAM